MWTFFFQNWTKTSGDVPNPAHRLSDCLWHGPQLPATEVSSKPSIFSMNIFISPPLVYNEVHMMYGFCRSNHTSFYVSIHPFYLIFSERRFRKRPPMPHQLPTSQSCPPPKVLSFPPPMPRFSQPASVQSFLPPLPKSNRTQIDVVSF